MIAARRGKVICDMRPPQSKTHRHHESPFDYRKGDHLSMDPVGPVKAPAPRGLDSMMAYGDKPSPSTPIKSAAIRAIIWNKEFNSLTLYKERYHRYRATSSRAVLVGVLGDPSFLPGLFLRHAAGAF